jgi:hypothetical protein
MNENTSLFSHADLQIQLHKPASAPHQDVPALALRESAPVYRAKPERKTTRPAKKGKTAAV